MKAQPPSPLFPERHANTSNFHNARRRMHPRDNPGRTDVQVDDLPCSLIPLLPCCIPLLPLSLPHGPTKKLLYKLGRRRCHHIG